VGDVGSVLDMQGSEIVIDMPTIKKPWHHA